MYYYLFFLSLSLTILYESILISWKVVKIDFEENDYEFICLFRSDYFLESTS